MRKEREGMVRLICAVVLLICSLINIGVMLNQIRRINKERKEIDKMLGRVKYHD